MAWLRAGSLLSWKCCGRAHCGGGARRLHNDEWRAHHRRPRWLPPARHHGRLQHPPVPLQRRAYHVLQVCRGRPVTVVVPQGAGGANDAIARIVLQRVSELLGQTFIVDNRVGAGGNIGTAYSAKAKADGYTLMLTSDSAQVVAPALYKAPGFDPIKDFEPVAAVAPAG